MQPYVYRIKHKISKEFYYGVQYNKNSNPNDLWTKYFTSSDYVRTIIENEGKDIFDVKVCKIFDCASTACLYEEKIISRVIKYTTCLNKQNNFKFSPIWHEERTSKTHNTLLKIDSNGVTGYQKRGLLIKGILKTKEHIDNIIITKSKFGDDGLTSYQRASRYGENNSSTRDDVKEKISKSITKLHDIGGIYNTEETKQKGKNTKLKIGDDGLNSYQRQSNKILGSLNVMYDTIWVNNGIEEFRVERDLIPENYLIGRLNSIKGHKYEIQECQYCGHFGGGGNMKRYHFENCKNKVKYEEND